MQIKGQTKAEFLKNYTRVKDIVTKSGGDKNKQILLAQRQANLIKDEDKAINRALAAKELGNEDIFEVFFRKAWQLGSVDGAKHTSARGITVQKEYRDYVISKLLD